MKLKKFNHQPNAISERMDDLSLVENRVLYHVVNQMATTMEDAPDAPSEDLIGINVQGELVLIKEPAPKPLGPNLTFIIPLTFFGDSNYPRLRESLKKLQKRTFTIKDDSKKNHFLSITPFPLVEITTSEIRVVMMADVVPYFQRLKGGYTKYELNAALKLTSTYSQKLFELLSRHKNKGEWLIEPNKLKIAMSATTYRYADFKRRCIIPALNEIEEKTDLRIDLKEEKPSKTVTNLLFIIKTEIKLAREDAQLDLIEINKLSPAETALYMNNLTHDYNFTAKQIDKIITNGGLWKRFVEIDALIFRGALKPDNKTAYVVSCLFDPKNKLKN